MGYQRGDNHYGGGRYGERDRWRDQDRSQWDREGRERGFERSGRDDDRSFFERAGDEVRSWFRDDDDDDRARERGGRYGQEYRGDYRSERDRSDRGDRYAGERNRFSGSREGRFGDYSPYGPGERVEETWGGSGFGGSYDRGRRFDRIDAGSTGTQGAHPMSSPVGGAYGSNYGIGAGEYGSSARSAAAYRGSRGGDLHDPHYSEWRNRQIESLDRDYDEYRRENQSKFEQEFGGWRERRQGQRQAIGRVTEHMEVVGSDGEQVGTVDKVRGERIILTKSDPEAGGHHHSIPCGWIEKVEDKVTINKTAEAAKRAWQDEVTSRALFEREDQGSDGPHALNRAFSGTY